MEYRAFGGETQWVGKNYYAAVFAVDSEEVGFYVPAYDVPILCETWDIDLPEEIKAAVEAD